LYTWAARMTAQVYKLMSRSISQNKAIIAACLPEGDGS
jgi:hypothetical protein